ncbi:PREDICTED: uncharacterized protein LOC109229843 [Nicotiana attenuata]|uniref:uncharacterized protein LOC109229843 n=1 Tax=Nicotiana attenuata TaxID=49451 RepID=UPI0009058F45|nr:PREDICTED: uncharacterized protein LOC109229843 [Nicotiana attenuata]
MKLWNKAAIGKLYWNVAQKEDRMWIKWIHAYYIKGQQMEQVKVPTQASWMVRKILEARHIIEKNNVQISKGKGIIKQIYLKLLEDQPRVMWKCLMFGNAARPKAKFNLWLQLQNRLLTVERLKKWGIQGEDKCSLCQGQEETRDHIYVECSYTREVLKRVMHWAQKLSLTGTNWEQHVQEVIRRAKGRSREAQLFKMLYTEMVHNIWIERNQRIFEKKNKSWEKIAKDTVYVCCARAPSSIAELVQGYRF